MSVHSVDLLVNTFDKFDSAVLSHRHTESKKKLITNKQEKGLLIIISLFVKHEQKLEDDQSNTKRIMYFY